MDVTPTATVTLVNAFRRPFDNAVATARTCYSGSGIVSAETVGGDHLTDAEKKQKALQRRDTLARQIYEAGHHTTLQHAHFQFALSGVSRQFIWSCLHAHPFYNSEQVSQRYVEVKRDSLVVPPLQGAALDAYRETVTYQMAAYAELRERLLPIAAEEYYRVFPARRGKEKFDGDIDKKAQEIARYVLPIATSAYLYYTVSGLVLLRMHRAAALYDTPWEQREIIGRMMQAVLDHDPDYRVILEEPLDPAGMPEWRDLGGDTPPVNAEFIREFDASLEGRVSKLVDYKAGQEAVLAQSVREIYGLPRAAMSDNDAIDRVMNPAGNSWLGETMNVNHVTKLSRAMFHPSYTFRKKISHTADSQDQRHRMTPASRPILAAHMTGEPDYITPGLITRDAAVEKRYHEIMARSWDGLAAIRRAGGSLEFAMYVLPNAVSVRFTESADLLNLHHKLKARLCYNAQEEIWRASLDEAGQIRDINPRIGKYLLPPCGLRKLAGNRPICPEGKRYCGVPVWTLEFSAYQRVL